MFRAVAQMKIVVEGKEGYFLLDNDTTLALAKEMCLAFLKQLGRIEDAAQAAEKVAADEKPSEPSEPVVEACTECA